MFYTVYKITNLINKHIYVGIHQTDNLADNYMGSGELVRRAIKKYGLINFKKEYLAIFENYEDMINMESIIVNEEFIRRNDTYNMCVGGKGGNLGEYNRQHNPTRNKVRWADPEYRKRMLQILRKASIKGGETIKGGGRSSFNTLNSDPEFQTKRKKRFKEMGHQKGEKNSNYGNIWITNGETSVLIKRTDSIPSGWRKGRVVKRTLFPPTAA